MRTKILFLSLLLLAMAACESSCSSCNQKDEAQTSSTSSYSSPSSSGTGGVLLDSSSQESSTESSSSGAVTEQFKTFKQDNWEITLPSSFSESDKKLGKIVFTALDSDKKILLSLVKEQFSGTQDQYLLLSVRSLKENSYQLAKPQPTNLQINNIKFSLLELTQNNIKIFSWIGVKNNFGYVLSCGGPEPHNQVEVICKPLSEKLIIN
jgi:hypothetical protein